MKKLKDLMNKKHFTKLSLYLRKKKQLLQEIH